MWRYENIMKIAAALNRAYRYYGWCSIAFGAAGLDNAGIADVDFCNRTFLGDNLRISDEHQRIFRMMRIDFRLELKSSICRSGPDTGHIIELGIFPYLAPTDLLNKCCDSGKDHSIKRRP